MLAKVKLKRTPRIFTASTTMNCLRKAAKSDDDALIADVKSECDQMHTSGNMGIHS